ncbi:hypothetical protein JW906_09085 [bacterium]|nr:hypothetical protein [bacterium]
MKRPMAIACSILIIARAGLAGREDRIQPYTSNAFYWQFKGAPILLAGVSRDDNLFQIPGLRQHLDDIRACGGNYIRNTMSDRLDGGFEVSAFAKRTDGRFDLGRWNAEYWTRFENLLRWTAERDIIVQIEIWDRFDFYKSQWLASPWNPSNNINYTAKESGLAASYPVHPINNTNRFFQTVPAMRNNKKVLGYQERFVDKLLSLSLAYDHVLYCMDNETSGDPRWGKYWDEFVKARADAAGKKVETTEMWDAWNLHHSQHQNTAGHPELYSFVEVSQNNQNRNQGHWDNLLYMRGLLANKRRPMNNVKIYGVNNHTYGTTADAIERFWRNILAGCASVRFHRDQAGLGFTAEAQKQIRTAVLLSRMVPLWETAPRNDLLTERSTDEAYLAADPGKRYILYFTNGGRVGLKLSGYAGPFQLRWINLSTGREDGSAVISGGGTAMVRAPGSGGWIAVITPLPLAAPGFSPIPYSGARENYIERTPSRWEVTSDENPSYHLAATDYKGLSGGRLGETSILKNRIFAGNFTFTLSARSGENLTANQNADFALVFAYQDESNYCFALCTAQQPSKAETGLYAVRNGRRSVIARRNQGITDNAFHRFELVRKGSGVTLKKDGRTLVSAWSSRFQGAGGVGIGSINDEAYFDDIEIHGTALGRPDSQESPTDPEVPPSRFKLEANVPNPFNNTTLIGFTLGEDAKIRLDIYDTVGRHVCSLADRDFPAGSHRVPWDSREASGRPAASGVYLVRIMAASENGSYIFTRRITLIR